MDADSGFKYRSIGFMVFKDLSTSVSSIAVLDTATELLEINALTLNEVVSVVPDYEDYVASNYQYDAEARLSIQSFLTLWQLAEEKSDPLIGFEIGKKVNEHRKGLLASWVSQTQNLGDALSIFANHISLLNPHEQWEIHPKAESVELLFKVNDQDNYPTSAIHRSMVAIIAWGRALCRQNFRVNSFELNQLKGRFPDWIGEWSDRYSLSSDHNRIVISKDILSYPIPNHNAYLENLIKPVATNVYQSLNKQSYSDKVIACLGQDIRRFCDIQVVCAELHISRSTLFRRLKSEDTSFTELLSQVRYAKYLQMKKQNTKVINIALELGFKDTSAFYKAAQHWD